MEEEEDDVEDNEEEDDKEDEDNKDDKGNKEDKEDFFCKNAWNDQIYQHDKFDEASSMGTI